MKQHSKAAVQDASAHAAVAAQAAARQTARDRDAWLDDALAATFPASDPVSYGDVD